MWKKFCLVFIQCCLKQENVVFTPSNLENLFFVHDLDCWSQDLKTKFILKDCFFEAVNLTEIANPDKYYYSGYDIEFDFRSFYFYIQVLIRVKNFTIFGVGLIISAYW